jgi:hypothetical protein
VDGIQMETLTPIFFLRDKEGIYGKLYLDITFKDGKFYATWIIGETNGEW